MKLLEYEAKDIFVEYGIPTSTGYVIEDVDNLKAILYKIGLPVILKAQVLVGGRGKAGGIKMAKTEDEAVQKARDILGMEIKGLPVKKLLVCTPSEIQKELYVGFVVDRNKKKMALLASTEGGIDIEQVAEKSPEKIIKEYIDPIIGIQDYQCRSVAKKLGFDGNNMLSLASIIYKLGKIMEDKDAELIEINPLAITPKGFEALDAKLVIDDNSLYRHKEFELDLKESQEFTEIEKVAKEAGLAYVELDGDVGIIGCGAGLVMASLDVINHYGGKPANFLDIGGGANADNMKKALEIITMKSGLKAIFINIFGGITKCDEIANGILEFKPTVPVYVRMMGTNEEKAREILNSAGYELYQSMQEAAKAAVKR
ncbi:MAG: ADP-forming succinate--CoA ligase subunit beta [Candidatus Methanofastidiosa archaeon]|nr:ADP-forming succinate--CoA ligase subunit beta [Candidatus Methanofastidiosa archaeon]